jgi:glycosyltransferase involved in cell wall biosynthesis
MNNNIFVSVICPTYNRHNFLPSLIERFQFQIYPINLLELIILDDSNIIYNDLDLFTKDDRIIYIYESIKMPLGKKRNKLNNLAKGDIIICMDDDDYYSPYYIQDTVNILNNSSKLIASCNLIYIYNLNKTISYVKASMINCIRNATLACKKEFLLKNKYNDLVTRGEEAGITNNFTISVERLSYYLIIVFNHGHNTVNYSNLKNENMTLNELIFKGCRNDSNLSSMGKKIFKRLLKANKNIINKDFIKIIRIKEYYKTIKENKIIDILKLSKELKILKFIASLTTTPIRISLITNMIKSLINQKYKFEKIYINIPNFDSIKKEHYIVPPFIYNLFPDISLLRCNDYGPLTKLLPILKKIDINEDIWIMTFDDDIFYEEEHLNIIKSHIENYNYDKNTVFGFVGFNFDNEYNIIYTSKEQCVDILEGYGSIAYHRSIFKDDFIDYLNTVLTNKNCKYSDDILISNYLAKHKINKLQIYPETFHKDNSIEKKYQLKYSNYSDSLKNGKDKLIFTKEDRYKRVIQILKDKNIY